MCTESWWENLKESDLLYTGGDDIKMCRKQIRWEGVESVCLRIGTDVRLL